MENTIGQEFILQVIGSSHGEYVGGIIKNCPKGINIDYDLIRKDIDRRRPQQFGTPRKEEDNVQFLSGITNNQTNGEDIKFISLNKNIRKQDYDRFKGYFRPSHADYPYFVLFKEDDLKYKDMASARMFLSVVIAGGIAKMFLREKGIKVSAIVSQIGGIDYIKERDKAEDLLKKVSNQKDTIGGKIRCEIKGIKAGLGDPIFNKISAMLAKNMMSIPSATSFSIGDIENRDTLLGSEDIDEWNSDFTTKTNHCGGINAGITNGMPVVFYVGLHAIHTLSQPMTLINKEGQRKQMLIEGRHDICQVLRTPVIVESLAAMTIMDFIMLKNKEKE